MEGVKRLDSDSPLINSEGIQGGSRGVGDVADDAWICDWRRLMR